MFGSLKEPEREMFDLPVKYADYSTYRRRLIREQYIKEQEGLCYCCENLLTEEPTLFIKEHEINVFLFPSGFFDYPIHLHHDHKTGMTIGAVHAQCNAYLFQYKGE